MTLNSKDLIETVASHAMATGYFDQVNQHEAKNGPGTSMVCDVTILSGRALALASGLDATSAMIVMSVVVYQSMLKEPQDDIDGEIMDAIDSLINRYCGDFTLDGLIRNVDIKGAYGQELSWTMGHIDKSKQPVRAAEIFLPLVINDAWTDTP
jgi:hypothetical protein